MILKNSLFYLTIANLFVTILAYEKDEFYCKANEQMGFSICRRCPKLDGNCEELEPNQSCHCDNIAIFDKDSSKLFFKLFFYSNFMKLFDYGIFLA